jgi:hypothetical protein
MSYQERLKGYFSKVIHGWKELSEEYTIVFWKCRGNMGKRLMTKIRATIMTFW